MACNCSGTCHLTGGCCGLGVGRVAYFNPLPWQPPVPAHGWECPKCGRVYGPLAVECYACNKKEEE